MLFNQDKVREDGENELAEKGRILGLNLTTVLLGGEMDKLQLQVYRTIWKCLSLQTGTNLTPRPPYNKQLKWTGIMNELYVGVHPHACSTTGTPQVTVLLGKEEGLRQAPTAAGPAESAPHLRGLGPYRETEAATF